MTIAGLQDFDPKRKRHRLGEIAGLWIYLSQHFSSRSGIKAMAKQKITGLSAAPLEHPQALAEASSSDPSIAVMTTEPTKPVVQTVKVPPEVFVKLKTVGARERRSSQDIILSALREYLDRFQLAS